MWRWLGILVVMGLMLGCAEMWDDVADFFDSGFADDDDGGGGGGGGEDLTTENLEGSWDLDLGASTIDDDTRLTEDNLEGTWNVSAELPDGLLEEFGDTIDTATEVIINENTFTFRTEDNTTIAAIDYEIIDTDAVRLTDDDTTREVQVELMTTGTETTMTITDGTDTGTFTFDGTHTTITAYDLSITETQFVTIITRSDTTTDTITETYEILDDEQQIRLTDEDTNDTTEAEATLSNDGDRLMLTILDEDGSTTDVTAVFNRIGGGDGDDEDEQDDPDDPDDPDDDDDFPLPPVP